MHRNFKAPNEQTYSFFFSHFTFFKWHVLTCTYLCVFAILFCVFSHGDPTCLTCTPTLLDWGFWRKEIERKRYFLSYLDGPKWWESRNCKSREPFEESFLFLATFGEICEKRTVKDFNILFCLFKWDGEKIY